VVMVNLETVFRLPLLEYILRQGGGSRYADHIMKQLVAGVLKFKASPSFPSCSGWNRHPIGTVYFAER
jgi:hypothetical protein